MAPSITLFPSFICFLLIFLSAPTNHRRVFFHHASIFQHISPLATGTCVAMLEVLSKVICPVELLARVAFPKLVHVLQMMDPLFPIGLADRDPTTRGPPTTGKLVAAVAAGIGLSRSCCAIVECPLVRCQCRT